MNSQPSLIVGLALLVPMAASAQDSTRTWMLGVDNQSGVYVGLAVSHGFRLEPELSIIRQHDKATFTIDNGFGTPTTLTDEATTQFYRVGVGLLWQWQRIAHVRLYGGPRLGIVIARADEELSGSQSGSASSRRTDWFLAGSLGAEYFPVERLSAGADVQLRGVAQGTSTQNSSGSAGVAVFAPSEPQLSTRGLLMVRFYM